jgi:2-polyprenyl-3-methyl-5-hydroxy-6-metoxy-1,4-benzoquinol methylase
MLPVDNAEFTLAQLLEAEKAITCGQESRQTYFALHRARFADLLHLSREYVPDPSARVLDVGRSELTAYLADYYKNIYSMGFDPAVDDGGHREVSSMDRVPHITFDLLRSDRVSSWPDCGKFDLIIFSEVIEHLCIAPEYVLAALGSMLTERGILICSTPNAADFAKRVRMVIGRNPYERLRLYAMNPGHVREYTRQELVDVADSVGMVCLRHAYRSWIQGQKGNPIKVAVMELLRLYQPFRAFQVCVFTPKH